MYKKYIKRLIDLLFSIILIILLLLPMVIIAVIIKLSSTGPILFKQKRYGLNSEMFTMFKFRSMTESAPILSNQSFSKIDSYVTPFGGFMRRTSLDEIPQLFNVLVGHMSFVGPRPMANTDEEVVKLRNVSGADKVRPGITGLAQVSGRNIISDRTKAKFDSEYANKLTFGLDLKILLFTFRKVISQEGINQIDNEK